MDERVAALAQALAEVVRRHLPGTTGVAALRRLSGGANQETWAFDATRAAGGALPLILRRTPGGGTRVGFGTTISLATEARTVACAGEAGVPVPGVRYVLDAAAGLGEGYVMDRLEGETIARKILRDPEFAAVRPRLARQCGEILARLHATPLERLDDLPAAPAGAQVAQYRQLYDDFDEPHPVFEAAFRWLEEHLPAAGVLRLVHGDFRNGNLLIGGDGVRAVLDWELMHLGDPMEDLGWICVSSWRYGEIEQPVGGFGRREDLFAGYEAAGGGTVDPEGVRFWEVMGTLKWGIMCMMMYQFYARGLDRSVERAAIGRRASETEIDLLALLYPRSGDEHAGQADRR
jgi:aminoglycoside phosphotransferase (APT) family kinase protein